MARECFWKSQQALFPGYVGSSCEQTVLCAKGSWYPIDIIHRDGYNLCSMQILRKYLVYGVEFRDGSLECVRIQSAYGCILIQEFRQAAKCQVVLRQYSLDPENHFFVYIAGNLLVA
ncbi:hypothetical protein B0H14DRAFT_2589620 [Mycena olivaceomarginata]|nr:hypothetical protein B0H14DRAFT_2589620 [Mycena olivaceomarginata]